MKPQVKVFTKDQPCTKKELWECFKARRGFRKVKVVDAKAVIGENAPKNMLRQGYAEVVEFRRAEYYELTEAGQEWLTKGILSFAKRHPDNAADIPYLPKG